MKASAIPLVVPLAVTSGIAFAQKIEDPVSQLRACSLLEGPEHLTCLERLSRALEPRSASAPERDNWIISETTSPVDYSPVVTATTAPRGDEHRSGAKLSVSCRGGRTEMVLTGIGGVGRREDHVVTVRSRDSAAVPLTVSLFPLGANLIFGGDVVALLRGLPDRGELSVQSSGPGEDQREVVFALDGLHAVRARIAAACNWPITGRRKS